MDDIIKRVIFKDLSSKYIFYESEGRSKTTETS